MNANTKRREIVYSSDLSRHIFFLLDVRLFQSKKADSIYDKRKVITIFRNSQTNMTKYNNKGIKNCTLLDNFKVYARWLSECYDLDQEESEMNRKCIKGYIVGRFTPKLIPQSYGTSPATRNTAKISNSGKRMSCTWESIFRIQVYGISLILKQEITRN